MCSCISAGPSSDSSTGPRTVSTVLTRVSVSRLAGDDVEEVPVLRLAERRLAVLLDLVEALGLERREQPLDLLARVHRELRVRGPFVPVAEELPAEAAAGGQRLHDVRPDRRERRGRAERQRVARVDEYRLRPVGLLERGHLGGEEVV